MKNSICCFRLFCMIWFGGIYTSSYGQGALKINDLGYFEMPGLDVMVFDDYYPIGRQGGITIIQNGQRVAANGDIMMGRGSEAIDKKADKNTGTIEARRNYPAIPLSYTVKVRTEGRKIIITADLDSPLPPEQVGKTSFQIELFPPILFGKSWNMDGQTGIFPTDSYGTLTGNEVTPYATGKTLTVAPETSNQRMIIKARKGELLLVDGRTHGKAGWFHVRTLIPAGETKGVIEWEIEAIPVENFIYPPVIQISQVGYLPAEPKKAVIELDKSVKDPGTVIIKRINPDGTRTPVFTSPAIFWGKFLRFHYATSDFSSLTEPGLYEMYYGNTVSNIFRISSDIYDKNVWQPSLEYYLPVQMCHMRVEQGSRVWHDWCHLDDALMAPTDHIHFDGYKQGPETFTKFSHPEHVPFLDRGGWHDAGDYDLRVESQAVTTWRLAQMYEIFKIDFDATSVDQEQRLTVIHKSDGIQDALQQVEHGALTILGGYKALGRVYRGIICSTGKQYSLQGDGGAMTDDLIFSQDLPAQAKTAWQAGLMDDRWVFTEDHSRHEYSAVIGLAAAGRVLKSWKPEFAADCIKAAEELFDVTTKKDIVPDRIGAAAELYVTTQNKKYLDLIVGQKDYIISNMARTAWAVGMVYKDITDAAFRKDMDKAVNNYAVDLEKQMAENPYGIPYKPDIWGAGWIIQSLAVNHYFLVTGFPGVFKPDLIYNAMQFVLGRHPGSNTASFSSGVGVKSLTSAYGVNRADLSYIPGGVASGTAIIRPDFPELKDNWPFLWQQSEYVMGGGATNFMFIVLATNELVKQQK